MVKKLKTGRLYGRPVTFISYSLISSNRLTTLPSGKVTSSKNIALGLTQVFGVHSLLLSILIN